MSDLTVLTRPNGKPYRARKPPTVVGPVFCEDDGTDYVMVLRTHDVEAARQLAERRAPVVPGTGRLTWERIGMWWGEQRWIHDDVAGMPCVVFEADEGWAYL